MWESPSDAEKNLGIWPSFHVMYTRSPITLKHHNDSRNCGKKFVLMLQFECAELSFQNLFLVVCSIVDSVLAKNAFTCSTTGPQLTVSPVVAIGLYCGLGSLTLSIWCFAECFFVDFFGHAIVISMRDIHHCHSCPIPVVAEVAEVARVGDLICDLA